MLAITLSAVHFVIYFCMLFPALLFLVGLFGDDSLCVTIIVNLPMELVICEELAGWIHASPAIFCAVPDRQLAIGGSNNLNWIDVSVYVLVLQALSCKLTGYRC